MKKYVGLGLFAVVAVGVFVLYGVKSGLFDARLKAPSGSPVVKNVPDDWAAYQAERAAAIEAHLQNHAEDFDHFANYPVSRTDGIPLIVLKLLPKVAPEFWGDEDNFLSVMGLFHDKRLQGYPFPRGIGFTGLVRKDELGGIDYASFTCGGCHIGRVKLDDGSEQYLNGGVNSGFNVINYRWRIVQSLQKLYGDETDPAKKKQLVIDAFMAALDSTHQADPSYFYNDYLHNDLTHGERRFDADYEAKQIALFKQKAADYISTFVDHQEMVYAGWQVIAKKFYPEIEERVGLGFNGMEDAIGFNAATAYQGLKAKKLTSLFAPLALPGSHGMTDIMVVWDQDSHDPRWNDKQDDLINGGGQWTGHIPLPIYKNIAAQVTLGFSDIDVTVSAHAEKLLHKLPPPAYPFSVDVELAKKGQALFAENCADCHQPNNGRVYRMMGTDMGRAKVAGTVITVGAQSGFTAKDECGPTTVVEMYGKPATPCAEYRGVSLKGKSRLAMTPPRIHDGYNALPLPGLWAQAPYLHNGSVPTLYHLLVPSERPDSFMKSRLEYDKDLVGFQWDLNKSFPSDQTQAYEYNVVNSAATSNKGHDQDITLDGKTFKLDWADDREGLSALLEYLKTL